MSVVYSVDLTGYMMATPTHSTSEININALFDRKKRSKVVGNL